MCVRRGDNTESTSLSSPPLLGIKWAKREIKRRERGENKKLKGLVLRALLLMVQGSKLKKQI